MSNPKSNSEDVLLETIIDWAATRPDDVVFDPKIGFYSYDIVADAYAKGKENAMKELKSQMRTKYFANAKFGAEALTKLFSFFGTKGVKLKKIFVNNSTNGTDILISIDPSLFTDESFIDEAYSNAIKLQVDFHEKNHNLKISFVSDVPEFNLNLLKSDGFGFGYNLEETKNIF